MRDHKRFLMLFIFTFRALGVECPREGAIQITFWLISDEFCIDSRRIWDDFHKFACNGLRYGYLKPPSAFMRELRSESVQWTHVHEFSDRRGRPFQHNCNAFPCFLFRLGWWSCSTRKELLLPTYAHLQANTNSDGAWSSDAMADRFSRIVQQVAAAPWRTLSSSPIIAPSATVGELRYGPYAGALDAESEPKSKICKTLKTMITNKMFFHTVLQHILHARSSNCFLSFPPTPKPPRLLKRPNTLIYVFFYFSNFYFWGLRFRANLGYGPPLP